MGTGPRLRGGQGGGVARTGGDQPFNCCCTRAHPPQPTWECTPRSSKVQAQRGLRVGVGRVVPCCCTPAQGPCPRATVVVGQMLARAKSWGLSREGVAGEGRHPCARTLGPTCRSLHTLLLPAGIRAIGASCAWCCLARLGATCSCERSPLHRPRHSPEPPATTVTATASAAPAGWRRCCSSSRRRSRRPRRRCARPPARLRRRGGGRLAHPPPPHTHTHIGV